MFQVHISEGNSKIDKTPNISLPPKSVCAKMPCFRICYARSSYEMYPNVRTRWDENLEFYLADPKGYFEAITSWIKTSNRLYFRWHVGGEIVDDQYFEGMKQVAKACKEVKFLVFTKRYHLHTQTWPKNLKVIFSSYPSLKIPAEIIEKHPVAWMQDGTETRIDEIGKKPVACPGHCSDCRLCWKINKKDVIFQLHGRCTHGRNRKKQHAETV
jgi:hypothetical protein